MPAQVTPYKCDENEKKKFKVISELNKPLLQHCFYKVILSILRMVTRSTFWTSRENITYY
jgi:hypothetical protein